MDTKDNHFNLLRLVLSVLVIVSHSFELVDGNRNREPLTTLFGTISFGEFAVDCFFIVSGFLITKSWVDTPRLKPFLIARVLRIYPAFIVATCLCVFVLAPLSSSNVRGYLKTLEYVNIFKSIFFLQLPSVSPTGLVASAKSFNGSLWSISYEFKCYLLIALMGLLRLVRKKAATFTLLICICGLFGLMSFMQDHDLKLEILGKHPLTNIGNFLTVRTMMFFMSGCCFYHYREQLILTPGLGISALLFLIIGLFFKSTAELALAIFGAYLLLSCAIKSSSISRFYKRFPDVSYGTYLYAWPLQLIWMSNLPSASVTVIFFGTFITSLLFGWMSWHFLERHCVNLRKRFS
jgi:peptidoglycan/LPS O-acetylase OafA/YrhL